MPPISLLPRPGNIALIGPSPGSLLEISSQQFPCYPSPIATNKVAQCLNVPLSFWQRNPYQKRFHLFLVLNAEIVFLRFKSKDYPFKCSKKISAMVQEVETNRLIPLYTPLFFGWTISLKTIYKSCYFRYSNVLRMFSKLLHGSYI